MCRLCVALPKLVEALLSVVAVLLGGRLVSFPYAVLCVVLKIVLAVSSQKKLHANGVGRQVIARISRAVGHFFFFFFFRHDLAT